MSTKSELILKNQHFKSLLCNLDKLEQTRLFCRHDINHLNETARIMLILNSRLGYYLPEDIVLATAYLHDLGRIDEYTKGIDHRHAGLQDITKILVECGYTNSEIDKILLAISCHNRKTSDELSALLYTADKKSRQCYECKMYNECKWDDNQKNKERFI